MTTEIDLNTVKSLIDRALTLKEEKLQLSKQLAKVESDCKNLTQQLNEKAKSMDSQHDSFAAKLAEKDEQLKQQLNQLSETNASEVADIEKKMADALAEKSEAHDAAIASITEELKQENTELSQALAHAEQQNHALTNRIKGLEL